MKDNTHLFKMKKSKEYNPMILITRDEALKANKEGYEIYRTINSFKNDSRKKINLIHINGWGFEIDGIDKSKQMQLIENAPLEPSVIIESKRGYHIIYFAKDATPENYREITRDRLRPYFHADSRACDISRVLREPGYYHLKDPDDPFLIRLIKCNHDISYSENEIRESFPLERKEKINITNNSKKHSRIKFKISQKEALIRLSGQSEVSHELFSFKSNYNGTKQICVNKKPTSCWIDKDGLIGSLDRGGPTIINWLEWYSQNKNLNHKEIQNILKKYQII